MSYVVSDKIRAIMEKNMKKSEERIEVVVGKPAVKKCKRKCGVSSKRKNDWSKNKYRNNGEGI